MKACKSTLAMIGVLMSFSAISQASVESVQFNPSAMMPGDSIFATVTGYWPESCYHPAGTALTYAGDTLILTTDVTYGPWPCLPTIEPWEVTFELGEVSGGLHYLRWTESKYSTFTGGTTVQSWTYEFLVGSCDPCITGDLDLDGILSVSDLTRLVAFLFGGAELPCPDDRANTDGSPEGVNVSDLVYFVAFLFEGGPAPVSCAP